MQKRSGHQFFNQIENIAERLQHARDTYGSLRRYTRHTFWAWHEASPHARTHDQHTLFLPQELPASRDPQFPSREAWRQAPGQARQKRPADKGITSSSSSRSFLGESGKRLAGGTTHWRRRHPECTRMGHSFGRGRIFRRSRFDLWSNFARRCARPMSCLMFRARRSSQSSTKYWHGW